MAAALKIIQIQILAAIIITVVAVVAAVSAVMVLNLKKVILMLIV